MKCGWWRLIVLAFGMAFLSALGQAQSTAKTHATVQVLTDVSKKGFDVPLFSSWGLSQADSDGNLYFHVDQGSINIPTIMRLGHSDGSPTLFKAPPDLDPSAYFSQFFVTPDGHLFVLLGANQEMDYYLLRYRPDGEVGGMVKIALEQAAVVQDFAVFETGQFVIAGYYSGSSAKLEPGRGLFRLYGEDGSLIKDLSKNMEAVDIAKASQSLRAGATVSANGRLYLLHGSDLYVLEPSGNSHRQSLPYRSDGFTPTQAFVSQSYLALAEYRPRTKGADELRISVFDLRTDELYASYTVPEKWGNTLAHFSVSDGFLLMAPENGRYKFLVADFK